ncbi:S8 family serine peptidase [Micromonospora sp. NPDC049679]|uniref:S8 family serine peptidase n=1 Tax=Micromonospora sp. NPDC049679 TaxID=3155920 RepID=UPI00340B64F0
MSQHARKGGGGRPGLRHALAVAAAVVLGVTAQPAPAPATPPPARAAVSSQLLTELDAKPSTGFMVYLREKGQLGSAARLPGSDARAAEVYRQLSGAAERSQRTLRAELTARKATYRPFWIANALWVRGDRALVDAIAARAEVERIEPSRTYPLITPRPATPGGGSHTTAAEWNLSNIGAPRVWTELGVRGEGIVIGSIDSGVDYEHPALVAQYRGNLGNGAFDHNYNWFDPADVCADPAPCDNNDHGTHTMGTMVGDDHGDNQIGVAPAARWIAAKGCETDTCSDASLLAAGEWMLAPTDLNGGNPRPDLHADIINNSWGGGQNDLWYQQTVAAWRAVGMFPAFAVGNAGPGCGTANSPGDNPAAYAVGAYDVNNAIANLSGRGASKVDGSIKPNIAAPGINVRSSVPGGGYAAFNGTSMATPHISGAVALLWSAAPSLRGDVPGTEALLDDTAVDADSTGCGGTTDDNNNFGEGRLDAFGAVSAAPRGAVGRVTGTVTVADGGAPLAGVTVSTGTRTVVTGPDGRYALTLPAGEHPLSITAYGYVGQTATVTVTEGAATTRDFALAAAPMVTVTGRITDGSGHGWPLYARIEVTGRPGAPVFTDPATGRYSLTVPGNASYRFTTTARYPGYRTVTTDVAVGGDAKTVDVAVPVEPACTAIGYAASYGPPVLSESFDDPRTPTGWSVVNRTPSGGWVFDDPGTRGNLTGGSGGFAIVDSDALGSGNTQDTDLVTPSLDLSGSTAPYLRFNSDWRAVGVSDTADIDVSTDGGANWTNVWHQTASRRGPVVEEIPLAPAAGAANARVRFRFKGTFAWWWQLDNVQLANRDCAPVPGGLVVGTTTDKNTGTALNGVAVSSVDRPTERGITAPTPDDPHLGDGFYWLFSSLTGEHAFTATKPPYQSVTTNVTVVADAARSAEFVLAAGRLTVGPTSIESHQPYGSTRRGTVTVTNTGSAPATVELLERPGGLQLLSRAGAPLVEHRMKGISKARTGIAYGAGRGSPAAAAPKAPDTEWSRITNLPEAIYDNAAASLGGKVYSVGGGGSGNGRKAWVFDPEADSWSALPGLPTGRAKPSAAAMGGKLYVFGGWGDEDPVATVDVFDPATGAWSTVPGATNPEPRAAAGSAVVGGKIYLIGGCVDSACADSADLVIFDPSTGTFSTGTPYPHVASWISCGGIGGRIYCAGGTGATEYTDAFSYDPASDGWSPLPDLPLDIWGAQHAAAGGLLLISGGVTGGSSAVSNRTIAYDPAAGAWLDLPNAAFARYRGAGACGAYKIGGSPSSFVGSVESERLGGLELCDQTGDVPWLGTTPTTFTLSPGASQKVTVSMTASAEAGVAQPGAYTASLGLASDTPYPVPSVGVEMNVSPPGSWGKIQGTVTGRTCGGESLPVRATVRVNSLNNSGVGYTLTARGQGTYGYWVPKGRYEVIVAKDGWVPQTQRVQISAGLVSTFDFTLAPVSSCDRRAGGM